LNSLKSHSKPDSFASYAVSSDLDDPSQSHSQLLDVKQPNAFQDTPAQEDILSHSIGAELDGFPTSRLVDIKEPSRLHDFTTNEPDRMDSDSKEALSIELAHLIDYRLSSGELIWWTAKG